MSVVLYKKYELKRRVGWAGHVTRLGWTRDTPADTRDKEGADVLTLVLRWLAEPADRGIRRNVVVGGTSGRSWRAMYMILETVDIEYGVVGWS